jgi:hypothetical protein
MNPTKQDRCFFIVEAVENPLVSGEAINKLRFKPTKKDYERWAKLGEKNALKNCEKEGHKP